MTTMQAAPGSEAHDVEREARYREVLATKPPGSWTVDDYLALPEDGNRYEVLVGHLVMCSAPHIVHQRVLMNLIRIMLPHIDSTRWGEFYCAPVDVEFRPRSICQPDLLFISKGRVSIRDERNVKGPPDLAIEILSTGDRKRDTVKKKRIYAQHGVAHYWIVDPEERSLEEFVLGRDGRYEVAAALDGDAVFTPRVFPGLEVRLEEVFRE